MNNADPANASEIANAVNLVGKACYRLVAVVGPAGSGKTAVLRKLDDSGEASYLNLGLELSQRLVNLSRRQRRLDAAGLVEDILEESSSEVLAVDNTEIIFEPSLKLSPLGLLQTVSRRRTLIWSCQGVAEAGYVVHAYRGHPEYCRLPAKDFEVVAL